MSKQRGSNKGFTLIELIIVIVILAILIGVTIGGVYSYVNQARINTDINNAKAVEDACAALVTNKDFSFITKQSDGEWYVIEWMTGKESSSITGEDVLVKMKYGDNSDAKTIGYYFRQVVPELPESKTDCGFFLSICVFDNKVSVVCKARADEDAVFPWNNWYDKGDKRNGTLVTKEEYCNRYFPGFNLLNK